MNNLTTRHCNTQYGNQTTKQLAWKKKKKCQKYLIWGLSSFVFLLGLHLTSLSTYLLFCHVSLCLFCFFNAESKQNCVSTPTNFKIFLFLCPFCDPLLRWWKKKWKKKQKKKKNAGNLLFLNQFLRVLCGHTTLRFSTPKTPSLIFTKI